MYSIHKIWFSLTPEKVNGRQFQYVNLETMKRDVDQLRLLVHLIKNYELSAS